VANRGIAEVTDHYAQFISQLPSAPIVVGHSFGGLVAQRLLGQGLARGCIAIAPAQFTGILALPLAQLQTAGPILSRPWLRTRTWSHTPESFHRGFANGVPEESDEIHHSYTIPAPMKPLFQGATSKPTSSNNSATWPRMHPGATSTSPAPKNYGTARNNPPPIRPAGPSASSLMT